MSLHKLTPEKVSWIIELGKAAAESYLTYNHPEVTEDERNRIVLQARAITLGHQPTRQIDYSARNNFIAAAWINGVSYADLGRLFGVRRQTISDVVDRALEYIAVKNKAELRLEQQCSELKMVSMYEFYKRMLKNSATTQVLKSDPLTLAKIMQTMPITDDEHNAFDLHDSPGNIDRSKPLPEPEAKPEPTTISAKNFDWSLVEGENK